MAVDELILDLGEQYQIGRLSSADLDRASRQFIAESPDATVYHSREYMSLSRNLNGFSDLLVIAKSGVPLVGIPVHRQGRGSYSTGYSGLLFPNTTSETRLSKSIEAAVQFFRANKSSTFVVVQSSQSVGGAQPDRQSLIGSIFARHYKLSGDVFTRVIDLSGQKDPIPASLVDRVEYKGLTAQYQPELRNQLRNAVRLGLQVDVDLISATHLDLRALVDSYGMYGQSRRRTGGSLRPLEELSNECASIAKAGGTVIIASVRQAGELVCTVVSHAWKSTALYWMSYNTEAGMKTGASALGLHVSILEAAALGAQSFEIGRVDNAAVRSHSKEAQIARYKKQFGGRVFGIVQFVAGESRKRALFAKGAAILAVLRRRTLRALSKS